MTNLKLACWNVNSLKIRIEQVLAWLDSSNVDILALQEIKLIDELFPTQRFIEKGYCVAFAGQKTYNGVAIISKFPLADIIVDIPNLNDPQRRMIAATTADIRLINLYVPNGFAVGSDKFAYKLSWLAKVTEFIKQQLQTYPRLAVVGDFNVAPEDKDVHDPKEWEGNVLVSPQEREAFFNLLSLGLNDSLRLFTQDSGIYSWWDYRALAFRRKRGLRIDHILLSQALSDECVECLIDIEPRRAERPSDHTPVIVRLNHRD